MATNSRSLSFDSLPSSVADLQAQVSELKELLISPPPTNNMQNLQANYDKLEPRDKLLFVEKLMRYVLPTQAAIKAEVEDATHEQQTLLISGKKFARQDALPTIAERMNTDGGTPLFK